jgi:hypothetical protein
VGASFSGLTDDREAFDFVDILISADGVNFDPVGIAGIKGVGDAFDFTLASPVFFVLESAQSARFVRYNFGMHSPDHGGGGSRIFEVFAFNGPASP